MSQPLNYTSRIVTVADDVRRQTQALRGIAEQVQGLGRQVEHTSAGEMAVTFVQKVGSWIAEFDGVNATSEAWSQTSEDSYHNAMATDRRGRDLLG